MFDSIRWRLVASYVLLTLVTVGVLGVLALSLVERFATQQASNSLKANAEAIAVQAAPLLAPKVQAATLHELAQTSAFLGNARVRVLDAKQQALVDSGPRPNIESFYIVQNEDTALEHFQAIDQTLLLTLPRHQGTPPSITFAPVEKKAIEAQAFARPPSTTADITIVTREEGAWGSVLTFERSTTRSGESAFPGASNQVKQKASLEATFSSQPASPMPSIITVPINTSNGPLGFVEVSRSPDYVSEAVSAARHAFGLAALGAVTIALVVGLWVSRGLTAPILSLAETAGQMSQGNLAVRAPERGRDEISQLTRQFNQMADRLQASFRALEVERDTLRRFIADASHELRTPITALKTFNELLQGPAAQDPTARREFLVESQAQVDRLAWLTRNLLDLSRLDAGIAPLDMATHDLGEIIESAASPFRALAQQRGIQLLLTPPDPALSLSCDRARIEMALSNLLDNALKFTPAGGQVEIGATGPGPIHIWVRDTGSGIAPSDLPHIFERFYRGRDADTRSSGLGLAIVQSIIQAHAGQVTVTSAPGRGSRFEIKLPQTMTPPPPTQSR